MEEVGCDGVVLTGVWFGWFYGGFMDGLLGVCNDFRVRIQGPEAPLVIIFAREDILPRSKGAK